MDRPCKVERQAAVTGASFQDLQPTKWFRAFGPLPLHMKIKQRDYEIGIGGVYLEPQSSVNQQP